MVRARVITADGVEHPLDPVTLTESSQTPDDPDMFEDGKVLRARLHPARSGRWSSRQWRTSVVLRSVTYCCGFFGRYLGIELLSQRPVKRKAAGRARKPYA